jgi:hypothetical protein
MTHFIDPEFTAFIGIDWADTKHDVCIEPSGGGEREFQRFAHRPKDIELWARSIHERFGGKIALALELSKGPIVYALQKYDFFVLFPIVNGFQKPRINGEHLRRGPRPRSSCLILES